MREVFVESREKQIRVAVKQNGELVQCIVEEETSKPQIGEIYKGRIKNIVPAINSIFVDIGLEKEAYMYYSDELKRMNIKKGQGKSPPFNIYLSIRFIWALPEASFRSRLQRLFR